MPQQILHTERITLVLLADGHLAWEAELDPSRKQCATWEHSR